MNEFRRLCVSVVTPDLGTDEQRTEVDKSLNALKCL